MVDEKTLTARHELLGKTYLICELKLKQHQKWNALLPKVKAAMKDDEAVQLFMEPEVAAAFLSAMLLDENGQSVEFTVEMAGELNQSQLGEVLQDFFTCNPVLGEFLSTWLIAILKSSAAAAENGTGKDVNSGNTLPAGPATVM